MTGDFARLFSASPIRPPSQQRPAETALSLSPILLFHVLPVPFLFFHFLLLFCSSFFFYFSLPPLLSLSCAHCLRVFPFSSIPPPLHPLVDVTPVEKAETQVVAAAAPRFISTTRSFRTFFFLAHRLEFLISSTLRQVDDSGVFRCWTFFFGSIIA